MNTKKIITKRQDIKGLTKYEKKLELIKQRFARFIHFYGGYNITFNKYGEACFSNNKKQQFSYEIYYYEDKFIIKFTFDTWNYEDELSRILHYHTNYKSFCRGQRFCKIIFEDTDIIKLFDKYFTEAEFLHFVNLIKKRVLHDDLLKIVYSYLPVCHLEPVGMLCIHPHSW